LRHALASRDLSGEVIDWEDLLRNAIHPVRLLALYYTLTLGAVAFLFAIAMGAF